MLFLRHSIRSFYALFNQSTNARLLLALIMLLSFKAAFAQKDLNFIALTTKNGLSSNTVNAVLQDRQGLIWIGTSDGLNKFDGTNFTVYTHNETDSSSIPSNVITSLLEDKSGKLWIGTSAGGLAFYNPRLNVFGTFKGGINVGKQSHFNVKALYQDREGQIWVGTFGGYRIINPVTLQVKNVELEGLSINNANTIAVLCFFEDDQQQMWVGTNNGLFRYNKKSGKMDMFLHNPNDPTSIGDNSVRAIVKDRQGRIFFGTNKGLNLLMPDQKTFRLFLRSNSRQLSPSEDMIYAASLAPDGKLWIGTEDGIGVFDSERDLFSSIKPDRRKSFSLSNKSIRSICNTKSGIIWLGTYQGGVNKYDPNLPLFNLKRSSPFDPHGLSSPLVTSFAEYQKGKIFVGTDGGGLHFFDRETGLFDPINLRSRINISGGPLTILALDFDKNKKLWIGTYQNGLFQYDPKTGSSRQFIAGDQAGNLSQNDIFFVKEDSRGLVWVGTNGNGVDVLDPGKQSFTRYSSNAKGHFRIPVNGFMRAITEDANGDMWLGSNGSGIVVYHWASKTYTHYDKLTSNLSDDVVLSILHDRKGNTWVGTNSGGLNLLNKKTGKFIHFGESSGLANGIVYKILEDRAGMLWLSTDKGVSSVDPVTKKIKNFGRPNGIQDSPFLLGSGLVATGDELYFGGQDGFNYFSPAALPANNAMPSVLLTELKVANNIVSPGPDAAIKEQISFAKEITLDYGQNFSISYVALNFTAPQQNHYSYKLEGLDKEWNDVGREKTAYYTNLDPGDYIFQVRASNNQGAWNDKVTTIAVHVLPPFWRSTYAYILYTVLVVGLLLYSRHRGIQKIKNELALEHEKINAKQQIEQHRLEAERLHTLDLQKIKFLTNLSHEFRTPISLILAPVDKLLSIKHDASVSGQIKMISRNARRLLNLVNQLLDFRKMEEQELKLNLKQGDLIAFINEAAQSFQDLSDRKKINLSVYSNVTFLITDFDHDKMERIVFNLLSNAFKFTKAGGEISLVTTLDSSSNSDLSTLTISVSDTGIGITPEVKDHIFERFFMDNNVTSVINQGSGIGLSIVKEFVELHGGEISVESMPDQGTQFLVKFPVKDSGIEPMSFQTLASDEQDLVNDADFGPDESINTSEEVITTKLATILLVEDNDEFRDHLKDALQPFYHILEASNGKEGWQKALSCHPALVVSDISMPEMNGITLSQKIKLDKRTSHIPVILLTAISGEEDQIKGLQSGANDYLTKPFNFNILHAKIRNLLLYNRSIKDAYSKQIQVQGTEIEIESTDVKLLNKIVHYVQEKMSNPELSVEDLSKHVGMSRGSLYHKLLEITGLTPIEYIRSIKLERAVEFLEKSDFNVAQIAYMTGFGTPSYFSRLFKAHYGMLPSEYISTKRKGRSMVNLPD
ncbi:hybrid sensor histidine kinase/response regulator transcription factor [Pedobacter duraquae]|uniref:histidine kinase n=1 Tax=Pedobacter duraquae TaxID=425511 RepID=A0A4R6IL75_9SPHI|nr:two-component regulator propeller domain-containing protein [Pedobacter duraquae]TDO22705.1 signal transduction histidine kinase [Pedobacter duraquae]